MDGKLHMLFPSFFIHLTKKRLLSSAKISKQDIGQYGEQIAACYLYREKYRIVAQNYRIKRWGEADIIAVFDDQLVIIEVKTRIGVQKTDPTTSIHQSKISALQRCGYSFSREHPELPDSIRIDVIIVLLTKDFESKSLDHYENIHNSLGNYSRRL